MKNRIKVLRAERDLTQADLGKLVKVSRQAIIAIESGKYDPSLSLAFDLASIFECKIEDLFQRHG